LEKAYWRVAENFRSFYAALEFVLLVHKKTNWGVNEIILEIKKPGRGSYLDLEEII
jgi:hypothetical protein